MSVIRVLGGILCIAGFYLLFAPAITLLSWIPLVGTLISSVASFAAFLFASLVGLTLSIITIALAWVFYRPLLGTTLLVGATLSIYFTFYHDWSASSDGEMSTPS